MTHFAACLLTGDPFPKMVGVRCRICHHNTPFTCAKASFTGCEERTRLHGLSSQGPSFFLSLSLSENLKLTTLDEKGENPFSTGDVEYRTFPMFECLQKTFLRAQMDNNLPIQTTTEGLQRAGCLKHIP